MAAIATSSEGSNNGVAVLEPAAVSSSDADRLADLERVIAAGISVAAEAFISVGLSLGRIRDGRLFAVRSPSFKTYVADRWGLGPQWAAVLIYSARVAEAIRSRHELPAGITPSALKPLVPLLNQQGPDAVAKAWTPIAERCNGRPPSRSDVRAALREQGLVTTAPERPPPVQLRSIEAGLIAAEERMRTARARAPLSPTHRERAARCAEIARRLLEGLEALTDVRVARAELADLEPPPVAEPPIEGESAGPRCECATPMPNMGSCVKCGRELKWEPRAQRHLIATA